MKIYEVWLREATAEEDNRAGIYIDNVLAHAHLEELGKAGALADIEEHDVYETFEGLMMIPRILP